MAYRVTNQIVEQLGGYIVRGDTPENGNLPIEADLAKKFGASRTIVREAIKILSAKGLVGSRPRRGTFVKDEQDWNLLDPDVLRWTLQRGYSLGLMREFLIVRQGIEPIAAREAALRADKAAVDLIETCLRQMYKAQGDSSASLQADIDFHVSILEASNNRFIKQFSAVVETALCYSIKVTNRAKGVIGPDVDEHAKIYEAIRGGEPERAARAVNTLLDEAISLIDRLDLKDLSAKDNLNIPMT